MEHSRLLEKDEQSPHQCDNSMIFPIKYSRNFPLNGTELQPSFTASVCIILAESQINCITREVKFTTLSGLPSLSVGQDFQDRVSETTLRDFFFRI